MKSEIGRSRLNQAKKNIGDILSGQKFPQGAVIDKEISAMKSSLKGLSIEGLDRMVETLNTENQQMEKVSAGVDLVAFVKQQLAQTEEKLKEIPAENTQLIAFAKVSILMYQMFLRQDEMIDIVLEIAESVINEFQEIFDTEDQDENFTTLEQSNSKEVVKEAFTLMQTTNQEKAPEEKISLEEAIKQVIALKGGGQHTREDSLPPTAGSQFTPPNAGLRKILEKKYNI